MLKVERRDVPVRCDMPLCTRMTQFRVTTEQAGAGDELHLCARCLEELCRRGDRALRDARKADRMSGT